MKLIFHEKELNVCFSHNSHHQSINQNKNSKSETALPKDKTLSLFIRRPKQVLTGLPEEMN